MAHCSATGCPAAATVLFTARGSLGDIRYRAALACEGHRRETRGWVARAGPTVHEQPLHGADGAPPTLF